MNIIKKKLSELRHPDKNVRMHTDKQIKEFVRSVEMFGQVRPIVCDETGTILCGNGLYEALKVVGCENADCYIVTGLTESEKKKLMLADNKIFSLGIDDLQTFDDFIYELKGDLDIPGYDAELLASLTVDISGAEELLSGYGLVSDEHKDNIKAVAERFERENDEAGDTLSEYTPSYNSGNRSVIEKDTDPGRFIICPTCGERIWL